MIGKEHMPLSRTHSYKQLYQNMLNFLKALCDEDTHRAKKQAQANIQNGKLFFFVLKILEDKKKCQKEHEKLKVKCLDLEQKNNKLKKSNQNIRKNSKDQTGVTSQYEQNCWKQIVAMLGKGQFEDAVDMAQKYQCVELREIAQRQWEYQWILDNLDPQLILGNNVIQTNRTTTFCPSRSHIRKIVQQHNRLKDELNHELQSIFGKMLQSTPDLGKTSQIFTPKVKLQLQRINQYFQAYNQDNTLVAEQQKKILAKIECQMPNIMKQLEFKSFYSIIEEYFDLKDGQGVGCSDKQSNRSGAVTKCKTISQGLDDIDVPIAIAATKSLQNYQKKGLTPAQTQKLLKKILIIGHDIPQLSDSKKNHNYQHLKTILDHLHNWIMQRNLQKKMFKELARQEDQAIKQMKIANKHIIQFGIIEAPLETEQENLFGKVFDIFYCNVEQLVQQIKDRKSRSTESHRSECMALKQSVCRDAFVSGYEYERGGLQYLRSSQIQQEETLLKMDKGQLVKLILDLREQRNEYQNLRKTHIEDMNLVQDKLKVKSESIFLVTDSGQTEDSDKLVYILKAENDQLKKQLENKIIELEIFERKFQEEKQKFQEEIKKLQTKKNELLRKLQEDGGKQSPRKHIDMKKLTSIAPLLQNQEQRLQSKKSFTVQPFKNLPIFEPKRLQFQEDSIIMAEPQPEMIDTGVGSSMPIQIQIKQQTKSNLQDTLTQTPPQSVPDYKALYLEKQQQLEDIGIDLHDLEIEVNQLQQENKQLLKTVEVQKTLINQYLDKIGEFEAKCIELNKQIEQVQAASTLEPSQLNYQQLFVLGSIFHDNAIQQRLYLIDTLNKFVGRIKKTKLLYRFDPLNKVNPHRYIDQHKNIVLIAKTIYGRYVACYSHEAITSTGCKVGFGLMISIWNRMTFEVQKNKRAVTYDQFFIIFGNSQLRIKSQQNKVFSNFGINNANFNHRDHKVDSFLGEGTDREVNLQSYEVYELQL